MTCTPLIALVSALAAFGQIVAAHAAPILSQVAPIPTLYVHNTDYTVFANTGLGDVIAGVTTVTSFGCFAADYAGFAAGSIALISDGSCIKVGNAIAAGAAGVLIYDDAAGPLPTVALANPVAAPTLFITNNLGLTFTILTGEAVRIAVTELVTPMPVPVPGTTPLLAGGLIALLLFRRARI